METTGTIAKQLGIDRELVDYLIRKGRVRPVGRAGIVRVFAPEAVKQVAALAARHNFRKPLAGSAS
jgi:hypothetical protein